MPHVRRPTPTPMHTTAKIRAAIRPIGVSLTRAASQGFVRIPPINFQEALNATTLELAPPGGVEPPFSD
jgi:hypothetical protein